MVSRLLRSRNVDDKYGIRGNAFLEQRKKIMEKLRELDGL